MYESYNKIRERKEQQERNLPKVDDRAILYLSLALLVEFFAFEPISGGTAFNSGPGLGLYLGLALFPYLLSLVVVAGLLTEAILPSSVEWFARGILMFLMAFGIIGAILALTKAIQFYLVLNPVLTPIPIVAIGASIYILLNLKRGITGVMQARGEAVSLALEEEYGLNLEPSKRVVMYKLLFVFFTYLEFIYLLFIPFRSENPSEPLASLRIRDPPPVYAVQNYIGTELWVRLPAFVLISALGFALFIKPVPRKVMLGISLFNFISALLYMVEYPLFETVILILAVYMYRDPEISKHMESYAEETIREKEGMGERPRRITLALVAIVTGFAISSTHVPEEIIAYYQPNLTPIESFFNVYSFLPSILVAGVFLCLLSLKDRVLSYPIALMVVADVVMLLLGSRAYKIGYIYTDGTYKIGVADYISFALFAVGLVVLLSPKVLKDRVNTFKIAHELRVEQHSRTRSEEVVE